MKKQATLFTLPQQKILEKVQLPAHRIMCTPTKSIIVKLSKLILY